MSSSGGNAGLAAAYCAQELGLPITVVVPLTTPDFIVQKIKDEGATVEVVGEVRRRMCGLLSSLDAARLRMSYHIRIEDVYCVLVMSCNGVEGMYSCNAIA